MIGEIGIVFGLLVGSFILYMKLLGGQHKLFYKPKGDPVPFENEQLMKIETYTEDGVKLGGFMAHPKDRTKMRDLTIVYMHGISLDPKEKIPELIEFADTLNCQVVMFTYRGYAYSQKGVKITESAIKIDAQAILDWVTENFMILGNNIYLQGKSFGTAVATYTATELSSTNGTPARKVFKGLILEAGFTTVAQMVKLKYSSYMPADFLFSNEKWETINRIGNLQIPLLILHGDNDDNVPLFMSKEFQKAQPNSTFVIIKGGGHHKMHLKDGYFKSIADFMKEDED